MVYVPSNPSGILRHAPSQLLLTLAPAQEIDDKQDARGQMLARESSGVATEALSVQKVWREADPRAIALLGALGVTGGSALLFAGVRVTGLVATGYFLAAVAFTIFGLASLVLAQMMASRQNRHRLTTARVAPVSLAVALGLLILALQEDPVPFISTITAALLSLGAAWAMQVMTQEDGADGDRLDEQRRLDEWSPDEEQ